MGNHMNKDDLQGLRFWCMKVLPTIYDDSLSYYEVLCKIGQKLNTTLSNLITLGDDFDTLEADITKKLQDFLTQYRADLKAVQDEVTETLAGYDAEIKKVQQDFADFSAAVDANFAALEASIKKTLNDEIADIDAEVTAKLAAVDTEVDNKLAAVQSQIDAAVNKLNSDFATLEASVNSTLTTFQTNITNQQTAFESLITGKQTTFENSVNADIAELEGKFTALQNYVDNYFANLDVTAAVTQAVNTKIQQMIDSGEFAELFGDQIDTKLDKNNGVGTGTLSYGTGTSLYGNGPRIGVNSQGGYIGGSAGALSADVIIGTVPTVAGGTRPPFVTGEPASNNHATTKNYVDSNFLPKSDAVGSGTLNWGGVLSANGGRLGVSSDGTSYLGGIAGRITVGNTLAARTNDGTLTQFQAGNPIVSLDVANKQYVDGLSKVYTMATATNSSVGKCIFDQSSDIFYIELALTDISVPASGTPSIPCKITLSNSAFKTKIANRGFYNCVVSLKNNTVLLLGTNVSVTAAGEVNVTFRLRNLDASSVYFTGVIAQCIFVPSDNPEYGGGVG